MRVYIAFMRRLRITLAQINTTVGDITGNVDHAIDALREAERLGSDLVVFPELTIPGYPPEDLLLKPGFLARVHEELGRFAEAVGTTCAVIGSTDGVSPVHNTAMVVHDGSVRCRYHKIHLPNYGVFDEKRYFAAGDDPVSFLLGDVRIGLSVCEDIWEQHGPHCELQSVHAADLVVNLSASPFHAGKLNERVSLLTDRARSLGLAIAYVNLVGGQDELVFDGGSQVFDREGVCIASAPTFRETLLTADLTFPEVPESGGPDCVRLTATGHDRPPVSMPVPPANTLEEEVLEALVLGTRDYLTKNGFGTAVIGLSGGIDSALVAAVAVEALGAENVVGVTMPSMYTSSDTFSDAGLLADNLGIRFMELPIKPTYDAFTGTLSGPFEGVASDVTEENLQARIRGTLLMALSNKFGWLVLTTGNKSEMSTGYATLYGDMAGGFAVIKDVPKMLVYKVSRLVNERAGREIIPVSTIDRPPSAELRPDQTDQDNLPPYDVLDAILKAYIESDLGVEDIVALGYDRETVRRVVRLCDIAEYKRRQAPPGVKITPRAFGRDRRLPITNRFRPGSGSETPL
jgi:NAD+ synthase (glutamine-hydrolysing)